MGNAIKERREELRMTQDELAKRSGISRQTISSIENGKYSNVLVGTLAAIATALDTTVDNFLCSECPKDLTKQNPFDFLQ
jgi:transcriptional regulator with XRE-family HTH domain